MTALQKISLYRERLKSWKERPGISSMYPEPKPEDFGLASPAERFMAKKTREEVIGR